jgi:hypothetical protein
MEWSCLLTTLHLVTKALVQTPAIAAFSCEWHALRSSYFGFFVCADKAVWFPISGGSELLACWSANASAIVLAFSGTNETLANITADNPLETPGFMNTAFGDNGSVDALAADPLRGVLGSQSLSSVSQRLGLGYFPHPHIPAHV